MSKNAPMPDPTHDQTERRLTRLEEAAMFHEQATGEARDVADEALRRVLALERRLEALEDRLGRLVVSEPDDLEGPTQPAAGG